MPERPRPKRQRGGASSSSSKKKPTPARTKKAADAVALGPPLQGNEYLELFKEQRRMFPPDMSRLLDPELPGGEERREELFDMIDADAALKYAWAVPDDRALRVRAHNSVRCQPCTERWLCRLDTGKLGAAC
jgi:hypothetical protein